MLGGGIHLILFDFDARRKDNSSCPPRVVNLKVVLKLGVHNGIVVVIDQ